MGNVCPQWWQVVGGLGTRYGTSWPWYDQFEAGWWQPLQLYLGTEISWVDLVLASRKRFLPCTDTSHLIWTSCWILMVLNLHNGLLPMRQCHGQGTPLLTGQLVHFPQCHSGLVSSRSEHVCLNHSIATGGSWYSRWEGSQYFPPHSRHWVRVNYNIMSHWLHVLIIVQCQSDGCSLSSKNCAVIRVSLR